MNSLPRKNYALNRVSHLTKSSNAIATTSYYGQSIANQAQLSSSIFHRLTIPQLSQIFYDLSQFDGSCTTEIKFFGSWHFLHLTWWLFKREQLLHKANQLHSSSWVWTKSLTSTVNADMSAIKILVVAFNDFSNRAYSSQESHFSLLNLIFINHKKFKQRELINNKLLINHKHSGNNNLKSVGWNLCK